MSVAVSVVVALDDRLLASALASALGRTFPVSGPHFDANEAERALADRPGAVAIIDLTLGNVSLVDRLTQWRTRWPTTRFVVCGHPIPNSLAALSAMAGVVAVIDHDVTTDELAAALRRVCSGEAWPGAPRHDRRLRPIEPLSAAEVRVLRGLRQGMSHVEVASHLGKSVKTIEQQVSSLRRKFAIPRGERVDWSRLVEEGE